ncbi:Uncharacterised protein [uncultured archaeon]|nr:Uncharacterised protein [uncultured archaeon]
MHLSSVAYIEEKGQVAAEFSNAKERRRIRYGFVPKAHFPASDESERSRMKELFFREGLKRIMVEPSRNSLEVSSRDFSALRKAAEIAGAFFGEKFAVIEPERQFLIETGWNYLDSFEMNFEPEPLEFFGLPDCRPDFISGTLASDFAGLLESNPRLAGGMAERLAFSRLLKEPPYSPGQMEIGQGVSVKAFLENVSFASSLPVRDFGQVVVSGFSGSSGEEFRRASRPAIDFSGLVSVVCSEPVNNLSLDAGACKCCSPSSLSAENLLPSSTVIVRFLREGVYFNSSSQFWAGRFHASMPNKDARSQRMMDYGYSSVPVGPFSRFEESEVLLADAMHLQASGLCEIVSAARLEWVCSKSENPLSRGINFLLQSAEKAQAYSRAAASQNAASNGLRYYTLGTPEKIYSEAVSGIANSVLCALPAALSRFSGDGARLALESISGEIARDVCEVASSLGARACHENTKVYVESDFCHEVFRQVSQLYNVKKPLLRLELSPE